MTIFKFVAPARDGCATAIERPPKCPAMAVACNSIITPDIARRA